MHFFQSRLCFILLIGTLLGSCQALDTLPPVAVSNEVSVAPSANSPSGNNDNTNDMGRPGGAITQATDSALAQNMRANAQNLLNQKYPGADIALQTLHSFETQVVAGTNYILEVDYTDQGVAQGRLMLTVYKDLEDRYTLTQDNYPG